MSTFTGIVHEFPDIRIDYFCELDRRPALACFLSHVHSDHLKGLDTLKSPFVYCSPATREILLRLEKTPSRLNYAQGITKKRSPTYKDLAKIVKSLPLETPAIIELKPGLRIQVTLLDANHCVGAVMFLVEGDGKAILYTGDIRSEPWWVNAIARNPCVIEYASGLKRLDCIYLDTSMLDDYHLESKANGVQELLKKVAQYPDDTIFHFQAWTYGYEEVWIALAKALGSKIHVDSYKMRIYMALVSANKSTKEGFPVLTHSAKEAPSLVGFTCGNSQSEGYLTHDDDVRIHSCEKGTPCSVMNNIETKPVVWIRPIIAHLANGQDVVEVGIGGGGDDLVEKQRLKDLKPEDIKELIKMNVPELLQETFTDFLLKDVYELGDAPRVSTHVKQLAENVIEALTSIRHPLDTKSKNTTDKGLVNGLPGRITFPYARHSSLPELKHLVQTFMPKDVWPCTYDFDVWEEKDYSIRTLFGDCCSEDIFIHDQLVEQVRKKWQTGDGAESTDSENTQRTASSLPIASSPPHPSSDTDEPEEQGRTTTLPAPIDLSTVGAQDFKMAVPGVLSIAAKEDVTALTQPPPKRSYEDFYEGHEGHCSETEPEFQGDSQESPLSASTYEARLHAYRTARGMVTSDEWNVIGLLSTTDHHTIPEPELGGP